MQLIDQQIEEMRKLWNKGKGWSFAGLAKRYDVPVADVKKLLQVRELEEGSTQAVGQRRGYARAPLLKERILALLKDGLTPQQVVQSTGASIDYVREIRTHLLVAGEL